MQTEEIPDILDWRLGLLEFASHLLTGFRNGFGTTLCLLIILRGRTDIFGKNGTDGARFW